MVTFESWNLVEVGGKRVYLRGDFKIEEHFVRNPIVPELVWVAFLKGQRVTWNKDLQEVVEFCNRRTVRQTWSSS